MTSTPLRDGPAASDVQGNVLAAFNKPRATFLLIALDHDVDAARAWLAEMQPLVATTAEVEDFYERRKKDGDGRAACWTGLGLTWQGLEALAPPCDLSRDLADHWAFRVGAAARAADLGDDAKTWLFGHDAHVIDAVVTVAADSPYDLWERRRRVLEIGSRHGAALVFEQSCAVLPGRMRGREHFGFKDGISQPGVKDFHAPDRDRPMARKDHPDQLLVEPGEFVLGWPREGDRAEPVADWLRNASFQVVRRLDQDVAGWNKAVENAVGTDPRAAARWANRLIGRAPDGARLDDTPPFAHIRKAFPRGEDRFDPQRHRLMRRGIPFGPPYGTGRDGVARGIVFNAFMASIERQFEHVQRLFANKPDFPDDGDGPDAVIGGRDPVADKAGRYRPDQINLREGSSKPVALEWFVETRGAVYALAPSKTALAWLSRGA